ncbi:MAG: 3-phosphoshikimate 1-carboxyvinyltransferase [Coriobacteriia bacterium]|nr:3-phosphoshikimate 1-carboxyvinyltransferase [Coriobacteriia bacterium]MCL2870841.1 3-phosphoshikimate 1-carboxyvinyltransferase [Coriobacteriia bacterium]
MAKDTLVLQGNQHCDIVVEPGRLSGSIEAIPSKSYVQRIYIAAALADETTTVTRSDYLSNDMLAALLALESAGAGFRISPNFDTIIPLGTDAHKLSTVNCGESGTVARLLLPVLTAFFEGGILTGEGSLLKRPFEALCKTLEQGGGIHFDQYSLPVCWEGCLQPGTYHLPGNESSQYISGLLFALPLLPEDSIVVLTSPLQSVGYVDMTLDILRQFGITVEFDESNTYYIRGDQQYRSPGDITAEGDWSNSAFWLAANVEVVGLKADSLQRDRSFLQVRDQAVIDATDIPDLVPILSVCAALRTGMTRICGIKRLRLKESDRIETTLAMLEALGCKAELCSDSKDEIVIHGSGTIPGGETVDGANDHRIVMAAAIAASFAEAPVAISGAQAVAKTYAHFFSDFQDLGGKVYVV